MNEQPNGAPVNDGESAVNKYEEASRQSLEATKKLKRRILIALAAMVAFVVIYFVASSAIASCEAQRQAEEDAKNRPNTIIFHDPDYEYNKFEDEGYMEKDRAVYYCDIDTGVTVSVGEDELHTYDPAFNLLYDMIDCIIRGDADGYNALFSENYYDADLDESAIFQNDPEDDFTMQQLYAIKLTKIKESSAKTESGVHYTQYEYEVEYKIRKNNGTFRTDIGSDASRKQYFVLSDSSVVNGEQVMLIERILGFVEK